MMRKNEPIRMCVTCRVRKLQKELIRLQHKDNSIVPYSGQGRSLYLCSVCSSKDKKVRSLIKRFRLSNRDYERLVEYLKELDNNG
jgi:predicted RNA-binding protein YlxR (DUF448 family)